MSKHADRRDSAEVVSMPTIGVFAKLTEWMTTNDRNGLVSSPSNIVRRTAAYGARRPYSSGIGVRFSP
jgi:hypothetical protein